MIWNINQDFKLQNQYPLMVYGIGNQQYFIHHNGNIRGKKIWQYINKFGNFNTDVYGV